MLLIEAVLPYAYSAFIMKSVGKAALQMVEEVRKYLHQHPGIYGGTEEPDFRPCIAISNKASLKKMITQQLLEIVTPTLLDYCLTISSIQFITMSINQWSLNGNISSDTGGAWDYAKKYIESGLQKNEFEEINKKGYDEHKAAVIGDTVGDPLKNTFGPSLNILIKLMAILSLVLAEKLCKTKWLYQN